MNYMNCVVVGDTMVGKSCLLNRLTRNTFDNDNMATVFIDHFNNFVRLSRRIQVQLDIWDTPGLEGSEGLKPLKNLEIDVCIICFSIMSPDSFESITSKWIKIVKCLYPNVPVILVGTMLDLVRDKNELRKLKEVNKLPKAHADGRELATKIGAYEYCECSAVTGLGVDAVFEEAVHAVLHNKTGDSKKNSNCVVM